MEPRILILDDDRDFNCLLTDIYQQANYSVSSFEHPQAALDMIQQAEFDLVVTDYRMPALNGQEFLQKIQETFPNIPVILVSGYLDEAMIRKLIFTGVRGVFLKPLNIFSLLERTSVLIQQYKKSQQCAEQTEQHGILSNEAQYNKMGFYFNSFPCRSPDSLEFANRLYQCKEFTSTLTLVGQAGTHYRSICEDLRGFSREQAEPFIYFTPSSFDSDAACAQLEALKLQAGSRVTCVLIELERMNDRQQLLACELIQAVGAFEQIGLKLRTVFCVNGDIDVLLEEGSIDENLYMLLGISEIEVPPLSACSHDIPPMVLQLMTKLSNERGLGIRPRFDCSGRKALQQLPLNGNFAELSALVTQILELDAGAVITSSIVNQASRHIAACSPRILLEQYLTLCQREYILAAQQLLQRDHTQLANFLGTDSASLSEFLN
jgi:DNA-binding NtrC family response regulator